MRKFITHIIKSTHKKSQYNFYLKYKENIHNILKGQSDENGEHTWYMVQGETAI